jgi:hypothetical protein
MKRCEIEDHCTLSRRDHLTVIERVNLAGRSQLFTIVTRLSPCEVEKPVDVPPSANSTQFPADLTRALSDCPAIVYRRNDRSSAIRPATVSPTEPRRKVTRAGPGSVKGSPPSGSTLTSELRFSLGSTFLAGVAVLAGVEVGVGDEVGNAGRFSAGRCCLEFVLAGTAACSFVDGTSIGRSNSTAAIATTAATIRSKTAGIAHFSQPAPLLAGRGCATAASVRLGALTTVGSSPADSGGSGASTLPSCRQNVRSSAYIRPH